MEDATSLQHTSRLTSCLPELRVDDPTIYVGFIRADRQPGAVALTNRTVRAEALGWLVRQVSPHPEGWNYDLHPSVDNRTRPACLIHADPAETGLALSGVCFMGGPPCKGIREYRLPPFTRAGLGGRRE